MIVDPPAPSKRQSTDKATAFFKRCVEKGDEMFGDTTDNMTGIVVYLNKKSSAALPETSKAAPKAAPKAATPKSSGGRFSL